MVKKIISIMLSLILTFMPVVNFATTTTQGQYAKKFKITAHEGYQVIDVIVNGVSKGALPEYTFTEVNGPQSLKVISKKIGGEEEVVWNGWNAPQLAEGLTPVNWNGSSWENATVETWDYNYNTVATSTQSTVEGNGSGKWANARTQDGSMYVWIPRYTYKILKGNHQDVDSWNANSSPSTSKGKIEVNFSHGTTDTEGYIPHPAFDYGGIALKGVWIAKYEASEGNTKTEMASPTNLKYVLQSKPGVVAWTGLTVSDMYQYAYNSFRNADSHLMKNSEWGAVAYLTNAIGRIPYINNSTSKITGTSGTSQDGGATNEWSTVKGVKASTTHNIYGIYDMSGGVNEYVSAYFQTENGKPILNLTGAPARYKDVYSNIYDSVNKGDAVYETSNGTSGVGSWDGDYSNIPTIDYPIFSRGGYYAYGNHAGLFCFYADDGTISDFSGFRPALCILSEYIPGATHTVTFNANDGTGSTKTQTFTSGESQPLTANTFTREGYIFKGWTDLAGATSAKYLDKASYTTDKDVILYAVWKKLAPANAPRLIDGLTPVNWQQVDGVWQWANATEKTWDYNYTSVAEATQSTVEGNGAGKWANAKDSNGSYYVWIPRYTYKILKGNHASGNSWNGNPAGENQIGVKFSAGTTDDNSEEYLSHPAFTFGNQEVEGIWVAKYEMSRSDAKVNSVGTTDKAISQPGVQSWRSLTVSDIYTKAFNSFRAGDSHLMKNSEWGAVAYLTNAIGRIPYINNSSTYITGNGGNTQDEARDNNGGITNAWNTEGGVKASTTHNVYGIYDMSGGAWEYVAAYLQGASGSNVTNLINADAKYKEVYTSAYSDAKKGDAVYETSNSGSGTTSWDGDYSLAPSSYYPVFLRGGYSDFGAKAGVFYFHYYNGDAGGGYGFRSVCVIPPEGTTPDTYTVTLNGNGGTPESTQETFTAGTPKQITANPTREGYTFLGWAESQTATTATIQPTDQYTATGDITLYAVWKALWNEPRLVDGLTPVNWTESGWVDATESTWDYNYSSVATTTQTTVEGNGAGKWANAKDSNGSYYVWIPRYTYKITTGYHTTGNSWNGNPKGNNRIEIKFSNGITDDNSGEYLSHPAFTFGIQQVEGIWVAKYEMSNQEGVAVSKPGVASWRGLTINDMYISAFNSFRVGDSHLMKNSEWGAVAYLTNAIGRIPYINNNQNYITGISGDTQESAKTTSITNAWNTAAGAKASTTHNVYGIYDMSGGAWEYVAAYYDTINIANANSLLNANAKYKNVYTSAYAAFNKGDAIYETSNSDSAISWDGDYLSAPTSSFPIFTRGGDYGYGVSTGIFYFSSYDGSGSVSAGFRTVLAVPPVGTTYTVTLNANGGTPESTQEVFTAGILKQITANPTREGYTFLGWAESQTATTATIQPTDQYTATGDITLYAVWKAPWNEPKLVTGLTPVNWNGSAWATTTVENWDYNYNSVAQATQSTVEGNGAGKWANAQTADGSMYVWIPRYTYKIESGEHQDVDSWNADVSPSATKGKILVKFSNGVIDDTSGSYIKHPAFKFGTDEVEGIWVAKYEASRNTSTSTKEGKGKIVTFRPGVISWRNLSVNDMYDKAFNSFRNADSHLMKNSEWGAVVYLTNAIGRIPYINNSETYITGNAGGSQDAGSAAGTTNAWNTVGGVKASTTHNVYGIYDMSGGAYEYVAAYIDNNHANLANYAQNLVANKDTKYVEVYPIGASDTQTNNYNAWINKKGDAVYETSLSGDGNLNWITSWDGDYSSAPDSSSPVFSRGGLCYNGARAGVFFFSADSGHAYGDLGFRAVCVIP